MNLQTDVVRERLDKLRQVLEELRALSSSASTDEFTHTSHYYWAAERGLQLAAESLFDVGSHILVAHLNESPDTYEEIIERLGERDVISDSLAAKLEGLGGFRNDYLEIDRALVHDFLQAGLDDFEGFAREVEHFIDALDES